MIKFYKEVILKHVDKLLHALTCFALVLWINLLLPLEVSVVLVILLGFAKEIWDSKTGGNCDAYDEVADIVGALLAIIYLAL